MLKLAVLVPQLGNYTKTLIFQIDFGPLESSEILGSLFLGGGGSVCCPPIVKTFKIFHSVISWHLLLKLPALRVLHYMKYTLFLYRRRAFLDNLLRISYLYYYQKKNKILTLIFSNFFTNLSNMFENLENFDTYPHILR
jgi:hypothetical protein